MSASLLVDPFEEIIASRFPADAPESDPYLWAMQACLGLLAASPHVNDGETIACMFDKGHRHEGRTEEYFYKLMDEGLVASCGSTAVGRM